MLMRLKKEIIITMFIKIKSKIKKIITILFLMKIQMKKMKLEKNLKIKVSMNNKREKLL